MQPSYEEVVKLYVATFKRAPDAAGLNYWVNNSGLTLEQIAQSFFDQPETQAKYPNGTSASSFVNSVYNNLFNRDAEQAGLDYWVAELESGRIPKQKFILAVINGAQNTELGQDSQILSNKQAVSLEYAQNNLNDVGLALMLMGDIDATEESVSDAITIIEKVAAPSGSLSADMVSGMTFYHYGDDIYSDYMQNGQDYCIASTINADGTITNQEYSAPFGGTDWALSNDIDPETMHWSIQNGRLNVTYTSDEDSGSETLTLVSQSPTQLLFHDAWENTYNNGSNDVTENGDSMMTFYMSMPAPRTEAEIALELGWEIDDLDDGDDTTDDDTTGDDTTGDDTSTGCDLADSPLTLEQMTALAQLAWYNDETGLLSTATIREAVIAQTGADAYNAAFEAQMDGSECDEIGTADMLRREDLANLPDTVETAENLLYGTQIHVLKNLDYDESMAIGNFTYANSGALEAYDTAMWDQYVAMVVDAFSAMENTPAVALSGAIFYPGASVEQIIQNMVVESTVDFVGMATDPNYVPTGMFDGYL